MFSTVLIANRGEIAMRIIRACQEIGLRTVAVYSDADIGAPHTQAADQAVHIGPTPASQSYLNTAALLEAAERTGADAVHPGYGFLSENADFARAVTDAGLVFVGPSADVIALMGRKDLARDLAEKVGVPVTPRFEEGAVPADAYPVLVKAAAGGGGKGMRIVRQADELANALESARREAQSAFGDSTVLIEKFIERGRHIEVQVFGDAAGHVVHLYERDCSVQRRHQKVIEEAPASFVDESVLELLRSSSVALCTEVGYTNAGTVEFLVDGTSAYFLEMNTRLQVEHPVTEAITGTDLVKWQLTVAAGHDLPLTQDQISVTGHAIEARIYAEDPYTGFLPQAGHAHKVVWPANARVESAFETGMDVHTSYDPMLAKVIVNGRTRNAARLALAAALDRTAIIGVTTNTGFVRRVVMSDEFRDGQAHTGWLDSPDSVEMRTRPLVPAQAAAHAASVWARSSVPSSGSPFGTLDGWRLAGRRSRSVVSLLDSEGNDWTESFVPGHQRGEDPLSAVDGTGVWVTRGGQTWRFETPDPMRRNAGGPSEADVAAPMPGAVLDVSVEVGDSVTTGDRLGVMEAMKMELSLDAPHDGTVTFVGAKSGEQVGLDHVLFTVEPVEEDA